MLELMLCSLFTLVPDYIYRRYWQGKRIGHEITLYSVWFELRWGIVGCLMLTVGLITTIFYFHPSTTSVISYFRTVPIISESNGRVAEVFVKISERVEQGAPIFRLDDSRQRAEAETAKRRVAEIDAQMTVAQNELAAAEGQVQQARSAHKQALDELETKEELNRRNSDIVARREIERLQNAVAQRLGAVDAAVSSKQAVETRISTLLPAQKASAQAALAQAEVELGKTVIRAGVSGRVEQFALQVGDIVNPFMRAAGVLIADNPGGRRVLHAGFGQIEGQVMTPGMLAEVTCVSNPWKVVPLVVTAVQDFIAAGQFRGGEQLVDPSQISRPGTILVYMEPLYPGGLDNVVPGSSCIANAYTSNHERLASKDVGFLSSIALHAVDTVGVIHAMLLRIQALLLPIKTLVFSGH
jgi:multidrug resistance efflux pump